MTIHGASLSDWTHFDLTLGLTADLLPAVCRPGLPIAPRSTLTAYGKTPSLLDAHGHVVGLANWTSRITTDADLTRWMARPEYGICLQTRSVRALDVDVTDHRLAYEIDGALDRWARWHGIRWPIRTRCDSSKFLILFELPGTYGKQTLQTEGGVIEFLGNGQQCLVAGTHPSGARYEWLSGLPAVIPRLTPTEFAELLLFLEFEFGAEDLVDGTRAEWSEPRTTTPRGTHAPVALDDVPDDVVRYLRTATEGGEPWLLSTSPDGRMHVRCPWAASHTSGTDETATSYFPAGTGGYERGAFRCLHAHCTHRSTSEWLHAIGWTLDGFENLGPGLTVIGMEHVCGICGAAFGCRHTEADVLTAFGVDDPHDLIGRDPSAAPPTSPLDLPRFDRHKDGRIKTTLHNLVLALTRPDVSGALIERDQYTDTLTVRLDGAPRRPFKDSDYTRLNLKLTHLGFGPGPIAAQPLRDAVGFVADDQPFDSAIDWLRGLPAWDGVRRVASFCATYLGCEDTAYTQAVSRYWWSAHAGRVLSPGVQADMAIVLIGNQGSGKTSAIKAIVPSMEHYTEINLMERDEDLSRSMRGKMIGELAELRGINSREIESIKAWVSRQEERWTPKYLEFSRAFPRRLVLVGTSNQEEFLADETGNRRWLPLMVGDRQDREGIARDRDQLWAEARALYEAHGVLWQDAEMLAQAEHGRFRIHDPWEEAVKGWLLQPGLDGCPPASREFLQLNDVLEDALHFDVKHIKRAEQMRVGKILHILGYRRVLRRVDGRPKRVWMQMGGV